MARGKKRLRGGGGGGGDSTASNSISLNARGISGGGGGAAANDDDALEECLAELETSIFSTSTITNSVAVAVAVAVAAAGGGGSSTLSSMNDKAESDGVTTTKRDDSNLMTTTTTTPINNNNNKKNVFHKLNRDQVEAWNISFLEWAKHSGSHKNSKNNSSSSSHSKHHSSNNNNNNNNNLGTDLFPSLDVELSRHYKVMALSTFLIDECQQKLGVELRMPSFERWLMDSKLDEDEKYDQGKAVVVWTKRSKHKAKKPKTQTTSSFAQYRDPVLPSRVTVHEEASQRLIQEILSRCNGRGGGRGSGGGGRHHHGHHHHHPQPPKNGNPHAIDMKRQNAATAVKIVTQLCYKCTTAVHELTAERIRYLHQPPLRKGDWIELELHDNDNDNDDHGDQQDDDDDDDDDNDESTAGAATSPANNRHTNNNNNDNKRHYYSILLHRKKRTKPFCVKINVHHYNKLKARFLRVHRQDDSTSFQLLERFLSSPTTTSSSAASNSSFHQSHYYHHHHQHRRVMEGFHLLLMTLLLRYSSLSGGHLLKVWRGGGMQGACHEQVFDVLQQHLSKQKQHDDDNHDDDNNNHNHNDNIIMFECFASPLNAHLPQFASAFGPDLDWHFGSVGSFFSVGKRSQTKTTTTTTAAVSVYTDYYAKMGGLYQANPPFCPGLMMSMAKTMLYNLALADNHTGTDTDTDTATEYRNTALSFVVIVPTVRDDENAMNDNQKDNDTTTTRRTTNTKSVEHKSSSSATASSTISVPQQQFAKPSFDLMVSSVYCRLHIILPARDHGYMVGAQHVRPTQYKQSNYDTSIILLQNQHSFRMQNQPWKKEQQIFEQDLRRAFQSREGKVETQQQQKKLHNQQQQQQQPSRISQEEEDDDDDEVNDEDKGNVDDEHKEEEEED